ncbi:hypothetical protein QJQ45_023710 [Haematococcus lacustris]|nr:hypothetical protein QJQ45_023710 [Haematococcus lacustris]
MAAVLILLLLAPLGHAQLQHHLYSKPISNATLAQEMTACGAFGPGAWTFKQAQPPDAQALWGTLFAQRQIWEHQHPYDCRTRKLAVYSPERLWHGIGSHLHSIGISMGLAMYHVQQHELHRANVSTAVLVRLPSDNQKLPSPQSEELGIPEVFKAMLEQSPIPRVWWYYWWRCQSSAFMVRPTSLTLAKLQLAREQRFSPADREALATQSWVSVYVRRGDKAKETPGMVTDPAVFMSAATRLMQAKEAGSPLQRIFLATEDVDVHAYFVTQATVPVMVANVSRYKANVSYSPLEHAARIGPHVEFIDSLLSLELTMGGDAFVYSMVSNWGRLVNELRSTVSCKAGRPFFDPDQPAGVKTLFWK